MEMKEQRRESTEVKAPHSFQRGKALQKWVVVIQAPGLIDYKEWLSRNDRERRKISETGFL